jgi:hypothetical protein
VFDEEEKFSDPDGGQGGEVPDSGEDDFDGGGYSGDDYDRTSVFDRAVKKNNAVVDKIGTAVGETAEAAGVSVGYVDEEEKFSDPDGGQGGEVPDSGEDDFDGGGYSGDDYDRTSVFDRAVKKNNAVVDKIGTAVGETAEAAGVSVGYEENDDGERFGVLDRGGDRDQSIFFALLNVIGVPPPKSIE